MKRINSGKLRAAACEARERRLRVEFEAFAAAKAVTDAEKRPKPLDDLFKR